MGDKYFLGLYSGMKTERIMLSTLNNDLIYNSKLTIFYSKN